MSTSYYGLSTASVDISNAGNLTKTGGGSATSDTPGTQTLNYNNDGWIRISFPGGAESIIGALPSAGNGHGWLLDNTSLEGQTIPSGSWAALFTLVCSAVGAAGTVAAQFFKLNVGTAAYTLIATAESSSGQSIGTTPAAFTLTATGIVSVTFATGEKLYIELYWDQASGGSASNLTSVRVASTSSGVPGASGGLEIQVPGGGSPNALAGTLDAAATLSGALTVTKALHSSLNAVAALSGTLSVSRALRGTLATPVTLAATLSVSKALRGTLASVATLAGGLTVGRAPTLFGARITANAGGGPLMSASAAGAAAITTIAEA